MIEQKEPHVGRLGFENVEQPKTFEERKKMAILMRDEFEIPMRILVDGMDDASRVFFSDLPSPAFVIDRDGIIREKLPWADPEPLGKSIDQVLATKPSFDEPKASWTLEQRIARARTLLAYGRAADALTWIDARSPEPKVPMTTCVPPTLVAEAEAAICRAMAAKARLAKDDAAAAEAFDRSLAEIRTKIDTAFPSDAGRKVAALTELADIAIGPKTRLEILKAAQSALEAGAPLSVRQWLEKAIRDITPENKK